MKEQKYNPKKIEKKWQKYWESKKLFRAKDGGKKKFYSLVEFPYPSGDGLHVGHVRSYTALDVVSRKRRMEGYNVLYPMGWDAFGLPTENYAVKTGIQPSIVTKKNSDNFRRQIKSLGTSFDWSREINTTDPAYYKWTQWIFLQFFKQGLAYKAKAKINWCPSCKIGLANEEVLAGENNDVPGRCERCGSAVEEREKEQWMLAITKYADRLDKDLDLVDYPERVKTSQRNWIGRKEGYEIGFRKVASKASEARRSDAVGQANGASEAIKIFTTRPETIYGATFIAKAGKVDRFTGVYAINPATQEKIPIWEAEYVMEGVGSGAIMGVPAHDERDYGFAQKNNLEVKEVVIPIRIDKGNPPKEGFKKVTRQAIHAIVRNPKTGKILTLEWTKFPWRTLVIGGVEEGEDVVSAAKREIQEETGYKNLKFIKTLGGQVKAEFFAAHKSENRVSYTMALLFELIDEERDEVAKEEQEKYKITWGTIDDIHPCAEIDVWKDRLKNGAKAYVGAGELVNSGGFTGRNSEDAKEEIIKLVGGKKVTTYKLRDWVFSRQRYWGEPIPLIYCENCKWQAVPDKDLPVKLPKVKDFIPTADGDSPLAKADKWIKVKCPKCKAWARRETDVMPNWAGSSWYYLRYADSKNKKSFADFKKLNYWLDGLSRQGGVDWYNGGMEHTTLHLLYSRFWHKFLYDQRLVPGKEPYHKRTSHGFILAPDSQKMSKSRGNVINPDVMVERFGADALRLYEIFIGPFEQTASWNEDGLVGTRRFLERVWRISSKVNTKVDNNNLGPLLDQCVKKVGDDIEMMKFNTCVSQMMILVNAMESEDQISQKTFETFLKILSPFAPHLAEELWQKLGHKKSITLESWPKTLEIKEVVKEVKIIIQINGKVRDEILVSPTLSQDEISNLVQKREVTSKWLAGKTLKKTIFIPNRLINFVVDN